MLLSTLSLEMTRCVCLSLSANLSARSVQWKLGPAPISSTQSPGTMTLCCCCISCRHIALAFLYSWLLWMDLIVRICWPPWLPIHCTCCSPPLPSWSSRSNFSGKIAETWLFIHNYYYRWWKYQSWLETRKSICYLRRDSLRICSLLMSLYASYWVWVGTDSPLVNTYIH